MPDVWTSGSIGGLKARGGFEIVEIKWQDSKLVKLVVKSNLGGNLRLRLPNEMKSNNRQILKVAKGENPNAFYFVNETAKPIISESVTLNPLNLKPTFLIDIPTQIGKIYSLIHH